MVPTITKSDAREIRLILEIVGTMRKVGRLPSDPSLIADTKHWKILGDIDKILDFWSLDYYRSYLSFSIDSPM